MSSEKSLIPKIRFKGFTEAWEQRKLGDLLQYEQPQKYIVISSEYDDSFDIPVLTAGQSFILGWTNEKTGIKKASPDNPVIIFDDFVTSSHYVDFPFKIKSSAMKLLSSTNSTNDINFSFNLLKQIDYTPISHMRHWISMFAQFNVYTPIANEQVKIGRIFNKLDSLITLHQRKLDALKKIKSALLEKMFPKDGSNIPEIRFTGFTEAWEQRKLGDLLQYEQPQKYIVISSEYDDSFDIPVLTAGQSFILGWTNEKTGIKKASPDNPVIIFDDFVTSSHYVDFPFKIKSSAMKLLSSTNSTNDINFSFNLLKQIDYTPISHMRHWISMFAQFNVYTPIANEQVKIGRIFNKLDSLITLHQRKLDALKKIKSALLEKMFV